MRVRSSLRRTQSARPDRGGRCARCGAEDRRGAENRMRRVTLRRRRAMYHRTTSVGGRITTQRRRGQSIAELQRGPARRAAAPSTSRRLVVGEGEHRRPGARHDRRHAVGPQRVDQVEDCRASPAAVVLVQPVRGRAPAAARGGRASAATSSAARPAFAAASACGTSSGSSPRATSVATGVRRDEDDDRRPAGRPRTDGVERAVGVLARRSRSRRTAPARRCRGGPRCRAARSSSAARRRAAAAPPATSARASQTPPTIAAEDDPRPRACGITLRQVSRSPGGSTPRRRRRRASSATTRCVSSRGTVVGAVAVDLDVEAARR